LAAEREQHLTAASKEATRETTPTAAGFMHFIIDILVVMEESRSIC